MNRIGFVALLLTSGFVAGLPLRASASQPLVATVNLLRTTSFQAAAAATSAGARPSMEGPAIDAAFPKLGGDESAAHAAADHLPNVDSQSVETASPELSFDGLDALENVNLGGGATPPDQALAVGDGYVLEGINLAIAVYDASSGTELTAAGINAFFGLPPDAFTTDPKAYYDADTDRWFVTLDFIDPVAMESHVLIAVSQTSDPTGAYNVYSVDATNAGAGGCPCFADQPLIGADANGFYINTNEFNFVQFVYVGNPALVSTDLFALDKAALAAGAATANEQDFVLSPTDEQLFYSLQPATVPPGGTFDTGHGGTEYLMGSLDDYSVLTDEISVFALTNTSSLASSPDLSLQYTILGSEVYGPASINVLGPPAAEQPNVPVAQYEDALPLAYSIRQGTCELCAAVFGYTNPANAHEELISTNDDRMTQAVFANGHLFSALETALKTQNGPATSGIAWFAVTPSFDGDTLTASMANQGYVSVDGEDVIFPAIGVNADGQGAMSFTLVGRDYDPSAAYATIDADNGVGDVQILAPGAGLLDDISGYHSNGGGVARFGDYSAAVADGNGDIWLATEYVPNLPPWIFINYGTRVSKVTP